MAELVDALGSGPSSGNGVCEFESRSGQLLKKCEKEVGLIVPAFSFLKGLIDIMVSSVIH